MPKAYSGLTAELGFKRRDDPAAYDRAWRAKNQEKNNAYHRNYWHTKTKVDPVKKRKHLVSGTWARRKAKYGITKDAYEALLAEQNGRCYICGNQEDYNLRVDHSHSTGKIRKLLCANCNTGLGYFKEDGTRLRAAAEYAEQHCS